MNLSKFFLILFVLFIFQCISFRAYAQQQDVTSQQGLFNRWKDNRQTNHIVAYEAAKEYLRKYPNDQGENAQFMRRWSVAYEKVTAGNSLTPVSVTESISLSKIPAEKHFQLGESHVRLEELSEAENEFRQAVLLEPENVQYREALAKVLIKQGKWKDIADQYKFLIKVFPESSEYRKQLAIAFIKQENWSEAETQYRKYFLLERNPAYIDYENFGKALEQVDKWEEAENAYILADSPTALSAIGIHYAKVGNKSAARLAFAEAFGKVCNDSDPKLRCKEIMTIAIKALGSGKSLVGTYWTGSFVYTSKVNSVFDNSLVENLYGYNFDILLLESNDTLQAIKHKDGITYKLMPQKWFQVENIVIIPHGDYMEFPYVALVEDNKLVPSFKDGFRFGWRKDRIEAIPIQNSQSSDVLLGLIDLKKFEFAEVWIKNQPEFANTERGLYYLSRALAEQKKWEEAEQVLKSAKKLCKNQDCDYLNRAIKNVKRREVPPIFN